MYLATSIPTDVLIRLRDGARSALLEPLVQYQWRVEREPARIRASETDAAIAQVCRLVSLMHALGWTAEEEIPERLLDVADYGPALCEALSEAARVATVQLREAPPDERERVAVAVLPLCAFAEVLEAACLELAGREPVLQEALQILLAELESDGPDAPPAACCAGVRSRRPAGGRGRRIQECCVQTR